MHQSEKNGKEDQANIQQYKVGQLLHKYDLEELDEELERRWVGNGRKSQSLRALADWFNRRLLKSELESVGMNPISGESDNYYRILTSDDVSSGEKIQAKKSLEQAGVNITELERDFVSYGAVYRYLTEVRDVSKGSDTTQDPVTSGLERSQRLQERTNAVSVSIIESLKKSNHLSLDGFDVQVNVRVTCKECDIYHQLSELLENGGCECQRDQSPS